MIAGDERGRRVVVHWWTCAAKGPVVETVTRDSEHVTLRCTACGGTDERDTPTADTAGTNDPPPAA